MLTGAFFFRFSGELKPVAVATLPAEMSGDFSSICVYSQKYPLQKDER